MTLTEQWKKGELPEGDYYIKRRNGSTLYDNIDSHGVWRNSIDEDIVEVLAEVPSFELWKAVHEQRNVLFVENTKLKELLKRCKRHINASFPEIYRELLQEINQVLGEE